MTSTTDAELSRISTEEFLENFPPRQSATLSPVIVRGSVVSIFLALPAINLYCSHDDCLRISKFRSKKEREELLVGSNTETYLYYTCSNCQRKLRTFAIRTFHQKHADWITAIKFGELPADEEPTPTKLLRMFGADRELFFKGRRCERQGLGIGAAGYYRRVVENHKDRLFEEIISVCKRVQASAEVIAALEAAKQDKQFTKALETLKVALPDSLSIAGQNPLTLLHNLLSRQIHILSDEECLEMAKDLRLVLVELASKIGEVLADHTEVNEAVKRIMAANSKAS